MNCVHPILPSAALARELGEPQALTPLVDLPIAQLGASLGPADLELLRDIYVYEREDVEASLDGAFAYLGPPRCIPLGESALRPWLRQMVAFVRAHHPDHEDLRFVHPDGSIFRAHRIRSTAEGPLLILRRQPTATPSLEELVYPTMWREFLMMDHGRRGGLILLVASTGQGKSTTLAATVHSRLQRYAGFARTIEDPIELPLHGRHGDGMCIQTEIDQTLSQKEGYRQALRSAMRSYPATQNTMLVLGEVRDEVTAEGALRAAINGHLVLTTVHADTIESAFQRLEAFGAVALGDRAARDLMASATRLVIRQELEIAGSGAGWSRGKLSGDLMYFPPEARGFASVIRDGRYTQLGDTLDRQATLIQRLAPQGFDAVLRAIREQM